MPRGERYIFQGLRNIVSSDEAVERTNVVHEGDALHHSCACRPFNHSHLASGKACVETVGE